MFVFGASHYEARLLRRCPLRNVPMLIQEAESKGRRVLRKGNAGEAGERALLVVRWVRVVGIIDQASSVLGKRGEKRGGGGGGGGAGRGPPSRPISTFMRPFPPPPPGPPPLFLCVFVLLPAAAAAPAPAAPAPPPPAAAAWRRSRSSWAFASLALVPSSSSCAAHRDDGGARAGADGVSSA